MTMRVVPGTSLTAWGALLLDRDGLLIENHPYLSNPDEIVVIDGVKEALDQVRAAQLKVAVVTNQSGVGRGVVSWTQLQEVNQEVDDLLGPFDAWCICPHTPDDACKCRKPAPGLIANASVKLRVPVQRCFVAGDRWSDVEAAQRANTEGALIPTSATPKGEIAMASRVFANLLSLVTWMTRDRIGEICE